MESFDEVKPYPRGTVVHILGEDWATWVRTDAGWVRVNLILGTAAESCFTDKHVFVASHQFGYVITLPPGEEY